MIVDTQTNMKIDTTQFSIQCELLESLIETALDDATIKIGPVALTYLLGLQTLCNKISDQNDLDSTDEGPSCSGCTCPAELCDDCEY